MKLDRKLPNIFVSKNGFMKGLLIPRLPKAVGLMNLLGFDITNNKPMFQAQSSLIQIMKSFGSGNSFN